MVRCCFALLLCAGWAPAEDLVPRIAAHLTASNLTADVAYLASDTLEGRATPSRGLDAAAEYIASQFRKAGLEPAGEGGYFQTATYSLVTPNMEGFAIEAGGTRVTTAVLRQAAATELKDVPVLRVTPAGLSELGAGQARGKILAIDLGEGGFQGMRRLATLAPLEPAMVVVLGASLPPEGGARGALRGPSEPAPAFAIAAVTSAALSAALAAPGATATVHIAAPKVETVTARNVAGLLRGADPALKETYLIVTAHYDHLGREGSGPGGEIFYGANDDASGTASAIEIATALSALGEKPRRSILFLAVFGEETGGYGARYYTAHPIFPLNQTIADINLEQLGRTDDIEGPRVRQFNLTGFDYTDLARTFARAGAQTGIAVVKDKKNSDPFFTRSDNATFAEAGIPSTTISVAYIYPDYHAIGDEWPKLDYGNMAQVDTCIALGLLDLADSESAPQWLHRPVSGQNRSRRVP